MKIALAQLNYHIGNFAQNTEKIINAINDAKSQGVDLIVFSELSVCGYPPHDLLEYENFLNKTDEAIQIIAKACNGIAAIVGAPSINPNPKGKKLYNSAYFLNEGDIQSIHHKTLLPTYDIFDEYRYFEPNDTFNVVEYRGEKIALTICEDLWDKQPVDNPFAKDMLYPISPMEHLIEQQPDLIINIAASPFSYRQIEIRRQILAKNATHYNLPLIYVNQIGGQTELIFDGASMAMNAKGQIVEHLKIFEEEIKIIDLDDLLQNQLSPVEIEKTPTIELIHDALVLGIKDYFHKMNFKKATLGLSGGIDSAIIVALAVRALGKENVKVLLMPSKYSSDHSIKDAVDLAENLGIEYDTINIQNIVDNFDEALKPIFNDLPVDITEENIQARARGVLLMALSNKFGHILLNTSNKSESAVGYTTLYGDMNGGLSALGDVYKTDVFKLAYFINKDEEIIPVNTIVKPPSAELRPDQKDSDSLPDYEILDEILFQYIELRNGVETIISQGHDRDLVNRIIRMVNNNEYKRFQAPPILRISFKAFGLGRKMPLVAKY